jgi:hypothetical protein
MKRTSLSIIIAGLLAFSAVTILFPGPTYPKGFTATIQPIQVCDDSGRTCSAIAFDRRALQSIFQQADLTLNILPIRSLFNSVYQTIDSIEEGNALLGYCPGVIGPTPDPGIDKTASPPVLNVWFAESSFSPPGVVALAFVDYNRAWVISGLGAEAETLILAHALGHNFGLDHVEQPANLMNEIFSPMNISLDDWQVAIIQASRFVTPIPEVFSIESSKAEQKLR